jgi:uncharacterized membrane protein
MAASPRPEPSSRSAPSSSSALIPRYFWTVAAAAFFGTIVDSLLGATLERPGQLGNNSVNFSSTAFAAALAIAVLFLQRWAWWI